MSEEKEKDTMRDSTYLKYCLVVDEWFINGFNGSEAYKTYYPNVSSDTAKANFCRLLTYANVPEYIESKRQTLTDSSEMSHKDILSELIAFATLDTTDIVTVAEIKGSENSLNSEGEVVSVPKIETKVIIKSFDELTPVHRRSIQSIKETRNGIEITFFPKQAAFEMIAKHLGFYAVDNAQKAKPQEKIEVTIIPKKEKKK